MRITEFEKNVFLRSIQSVDPDAKVYLFGSRVDDFKKGGDIDLLVLSDKIDLTLKLRIKKLIFERLEEQKIDLTITRDLNDPFIKSVFESAVKLS